MYQVSSNPLLNRTPLITDQQYLAFLTAHKICLHNSGFRPFCTGAPYFSRQLTDPSDQMVNFKLLVNY